MLMQLFRPAGKVTGEDWLELAATLEKRIVDRLHRISSITTNGKRRRPHRKHETRPIKQYSTNITMVISTRRILKMSQKKRQNPANAESSDSDSD